MRQYPEAYTDYLCYFHGERDYFECHEVMEEFWKEHPEDPRRLTYVGLIQIAVGLYHSRRGNRAGAVKMLQSAANNLQAEDVRSLGLDDVELQARIGQAWLAIEDDHFQFEDVNLPISDPELLRHCLAICEQRGLVWQAPSRMSDVMLIDKHTRRDRSEVIEERARQQSIRKEQGEKR
ncbi:hypothetical protein A8709_25555 [Paenibacillus pectinilyticus]|uniref:DUF309 domain-containing protein n=1 Tax=Paenibacillus pectinilyticus TaxID=512399 RepID=A0A1C1A106_9BACL|nr:DUF309 domain-containing protein [Paenibacillus pectinilyticus]OCT14202.1 hypothetical protein A8709_25555 [Paenibacillus pectinilyticus]